MCYLVHKVPGGNSGPESGLLYPGRRAAPQSRPRPRRSSRTTGRRHETQTINTTAPRRARLARSRSACSSSGLSGRSSSAFTAKPTRPRGQKSVRWPWSEPRNVGGVWDRPLRSKRMQSSSTHSRGRWASRPSVQTPACACECFPFFRRAARVCRSAVRQTKTGITKKQNEKITVAMALGAARLSLRIATTASRCRGGHVRDPINMPRDSGV